MGHTFDGIEEINNPCRSGGPMFLFFIVTGLIYPARLPGPCNFKGSAGLAKVPTGMCVPGRVKAAAESAKAEGRAVEYDRELPRPTDLRRQVPRADLSG